MKQYTVIMLDMNGTVTNTPFADKQPLHILPGRKERLVALRNQGINLALISNQGGVAFGYTSEQDAKDEVWMIADELGIEFRAVCFAHPRPAEGYERYADPEALARRKPAPGMLFEAMDYYGVPPTETLMVGDREEDEVAAARAGCDFISAYEFFG